MRRGLRALAATAQAGPARADGGRARRPGARRRARGRLRARAAPQRRRAPVPRRRGARAAADRGRRRARRRSPTSSTAPTPSAARSRRGSASRPKRRWHELGERAAYVLAGEGWHAGRDRDRRLAAGRAQHRPVVLIALDGERGQRLGAQHRRRSTCSAACTPAPSTCCATAATARPPGSRSTRARVDGVRARRSPRTPRSVLAPGDLVAGRARRRGRRRRASSGMALAEELRALAPFGRGNPACR